MASNRLAAIFTCLVLQCTTPAWATLRFNSGSITDDNTNATFRYNDLPGVTLRVQRTSPDICSGNEGIAGFADFGEACGFSCFPCIHTCASPS